MVNNIPNIGAAINWSWDYYTKAFNAVTFLETWTYYINGSFNMTSGAYTGGTIVGRVYVLYDNAAKNDIVSSYHKKV